MDGGKEDGGWRRREEWRKVWREGERERENEEGREKEGDRKIDNRQSQADKETQTNGDK